MKLEVVNDPRVQKRDRVGGDGVAEAGMKFLSDRRPADLRAALEDRHFEAGHADIGGGDEAVVTAAHDDDVRHQGCAGTARGPSPQPLSLREREDPFSNREKVARRAG